MGCVVRSNGKPPCGTPGDMWFLACVHEHGGIREVCDTHVEMMFGCCSCTLCEESSQPHDCLVMLIRA